MTQSSWHLTKLDTPHTIIMSQRTKRITNDVEHYVLRKLTPFKMTRTKKIPRAELATEIMCVSKDQVMKKRMT